MEFPYGTTVYRLRPKQIWDEASETFKLGDWSDPDVTPLEGVHVEQSSTSTVGDATRTQALESLSVYIPDGVTVDLTKLDRIRVGEDGAPVYEIDGIPYAPRNPFTGWMPAREVPLGRAVG